MERSPTLVTLALFGVTYLLEVVLGLVGVPRTAFALSSPVLARPWTLVTSVYAHGGPGHLLVNSVALAFLGLVLERTTSRARFHAFFVTTGALAGLAEVTVAGLFGASVAVLGGSGAIFALLGYLLTGNRLTDAVLRGRTVEPKVQVAAFAVIAVVVTVATGSPGAALIAHCTGLLLGLVAGRLHLLRT